ncbi:hypothetical protein O181_084578 [Austropuccinia psidii MF-1]|uniref:Uncharacterized protein n=1 Tax=Austropuccinia psidii MF-1 TaxID=1389203 RepID=A0A9Q3FRK8_9BASI|nr:hypothetical protein [Austropuccinia psidii MF-1]
MVVKSASVVFDESSPYNNERQVEGILNLIQVQNPFNASMIDEFNWKHKSLLTSTSTNDLNATIPSDYKEAMIPVDKAHWSAAIHEIIGSMEEEEGLKAVDLK